MLGSEGRSAAPWMAAGWSLRRSSGESASPFCVGLVGVARVCAECLQVGIGIAAAFGDGHDVVDLKPIVTA